MRKILGTRRYVVWMNKNIIFCTHTSILLPFKFLFPHISEIEIGVSTSKKKKERWISSNHITYWPIKSLICTKSLSLWKGYSQYECPLNYKLSKTTTLKKIRWATWNQNFEYVDKLISFTFLNFAFLKCWIIHELPCPNVSRHKLSIFLLGWGMERILSSLKS